MGIGNHDFDDAIEGLIPFAEEVNFPLLAANMFEDGPEVLTPYYKKSIIREMDGEYQEHILTCLLYTSDAADE